MNVGVIGTGHVGLPTAAALASLGHHVVATDSNVNTISTLLEGVAPFHEPGLIELIQEELSSGRLRFTSDPSEAIVQASVVFLCVGTPPRADGEANLIAVELASQTVAEHAEGHVVVVEKSTVPAGTAERIEQTLLRVNGSASFSVVSNPEFLREGSAVADSLHPDRILVGSNSPQALDVMRELYAPLVDSGAVWLQTDLRTAELSKHACNAFLAMKISYVNALARVCERAGADVTDVARVMGTDPRIGSAFLNAGLGYGGYCFPKDIAAFARLSSRLGYDFRLLDEVARINDEAVDATFSKIESTLWNLEGKRIVLLGLAFKPGTDDVRFAPALSLARQLVGAGASVVGYDPHAAASARAEMPEIDVADDPYQALSGAHCAVVCTEWGELARLDLHKARQLMCYPVVVDGRNFLDAQTVVDAGFTYIPTGKPSIHAAALSQTRAPARPVQVAGGPAR